jgi:hypothetical protein
VHGDFSRWTHDTVRHFVAVLEQQGRVRLDADFNEFVAIQQHLRRTLTRDLIGPSGVPLGGAEDDPALAQSFAVVPAVEGAGDGQTPKLTVRSGRIYVDGVLCELESDIEYADQTGHPFADSGSLSFPDADELSVLVYLDVWLRHISAVEDPELRDPALGGPDTTTRLQTICQVKVAPIADDDTSCEAPLPASTEPSGGRLTTSYQEPDPADDPCIVAPGGGYRGLENRLYRVEIHQAGGLDGENVARFKWSRDNGAVAYRVASFEQSAGGQFDSVKVTELGRDEVLALREGDWVELVTDETELAGNAGTLAQVTGEPDPDVRIVKLSVDLAAHKDQTNPRVRRWDGVGEGGTGLAVSTAEQELEDGVIVSFGLEGGGSFRVGDYWFFAARTITREVEILDAASPHGVRHHYARLAVVTWNRIDGAWQVANDGQVACDCRRLIPPLTSQRNLLYVSGDGQERMPNEDPEGWLCQPLQVRVVNGDTPVAGAKVRFRLESPAADAPNGAMLGTTSAPIESDVEIVVATDDDGLAECRWRLSPSPDEEDDSPKRLCQKASATLLKCPDADVDHERIVFTARLSRASEVANEIEGCPIFSEDPPADTVQKALDRLCDNAALYIVGGDGQSAAAGSELCQPLEVRFANGRRPIAGVRIGFEIQDGPNGELTDATDPGIHGTTIEVVTDDQGLAATRWRLDGDPNARCQRVRATVVDAFEPVVPSVHFNAEQITVSGGGTERCITVGRGGRFADLASAIALARESRMLDVCLCLMPGEVEITTELNIKPPADGDRMHLRITGCGASTRIRIPRGRIAVASLAAFTLRDLVIESESDQDPIEIAGTLQVTVQNCALSQWNRVKRILMKIGGADAVLVDNCTFEAWFRYWTEIDEIERIDGLKIPSTPTPGRPDEYARMITTIASLLAGAARRLRNQFVDAWRQFLSNGRARDLTDEERASYEEAAERLRQFDDPNDGNVLVALWLLARGVAIAFEDAGADVVIRDSRLIGDVHFLGSGNPLSDGEARTLGRFAEEIGGQTPPTNRSLRIRDNSLTRLTLDASLRSDAEMQEAIRNAFTLGQCTGNRFDGPRSQMLAIHGNVSSDYFGPYGTRSGEGLVVASASATIVGNRGQAETPIFAPRFRAESANLGIGILPF